MLAARGDDAAAIDLERLAQGSEAERVAIVNAIAYLPVARFRPMLESLLSRREREVRRGVLRVCARNPELVPVEHIIPHVADPSLREHARRALVAAGTPALEALLAALDSPKTLAAVRRHLPRTLSRFASPRVALALVARLAVEADPQTEFKLLRALGTICRANPDQTIDADGVHAYVRRATRTAARYAVLVDDLEGEQDDSASGQLIVDILSDKLCETLERVFRALGVLFPRAGMRNVFAALVSSDPARNAAAREILEAVVPRDLRNGLLGCLPGVRPVRRRQLLGTLAPGPFGSRDALFGEILTDTSESLRCVVAYHIAERNLVSLRSALERQRPTVSEPLVMEAFDQALARLHG
jgi:hypothetical protein